MAQWHLDEIRSAFENHGWRITAELPGDEYKVSATWEFRRAGDSRTLVIDFDGLHETHVLPLIESYACCARDTNHSLYFRRRGQSGSRSRERWLNELSTFAKAVS
jgi:hypothetical protein